MCEKTHKWLDRLQTENNYLAPRDIYNILVMKNMKNQFSAQ